MAGLDLKNLIGKLNPQCQRALEGAAGLCLSRTNYNVEIEHWLIKLLEQPGNDLHLLLRHFGVDEGRLLADLSKAVDRLKTGNSRSPLLSPEVCLLTKEAWLLSSVDQGLSKVRSAWLLAALVGEESLARRTLSISDEFRRISPEQLARDAATILDRSIETAMTAPDGEPADGQAAPAAAGGSTGTPSLDQFTIDLTARARAGKIDPVLGRDAEIRQLIDILTRRRQNNPILTGEAGVGKTAVVEGFAQRIAQGDVPESLKAVVLRTLDLGLLQAGAGVKGEFENRLKSVIDEVKKSPVPIILFIDEAHTLIGAGGQAGQGDAANLLKPALARGELRTIAATTWAEYKKYFEKDAALTRRFQVVKVEEPAEEIAVRMIRGLVATLESHHGVPILDEAVVESVRLSHRYIPGRQLPDKAVSLIDTAAARVAVSQAATPAALEDCQRQLDAIATALRILQREVETGADHAEQIGELQRQAETLSARREALDTRWKADSKLVGEIRETRRRLTPETPPAAPAGELISPPTPEERDRLRERMKTLEAELATIQGEEPLLHPCVDGQAVAAVVSSWTGIPVGKMLTNEIRGLALNMQLEKRRV